MSGVVYAEIAEAWTPNTNDGDQLSTTVVKNVRSKKPRQTTSNFAGCGSVPEVIILGRNSEKQRTMNFLFNFYKFTLTTQIAASSIYIYDVVCELLLYVATRDEKAIALLPMVNFVGIERRIFLYLDHDRQQGLTCLTRSCRENCGGM